MSLHMEQTDRRFARPTKGSVSNSSSNDTYDLVAIGFGTTSLSLAASLAENKLNSRVLFIEQHPQFTWNAEHVLPDKEIATSFLRDLTTTQNPRSSFTFMNFLHATNQLILFANNSRLTPTRRLMGQYFRWAAQMIERLGWVQYGQEAIRVRPMKATAFNRVSQWQVEIRNCESGAVSVVQAKRIVLATGVTPHILAPLATLQMEPLVLHSSSSTRLLQKLGSLEETLNIAIVGADQEAVELFHHLHTTRGKQSASLFFTDSALRPDDHLPSISDMLEKAESSEGNMPPEIRARQFAAHQTPKVHLKTLEQLYEAQYSQKLMEPDSSKWRFQIRPLSEVVGAEREGNAARLVTRNPRTGEIATSSTAFDVIISATGYEFTNHAELIRSISPLLQTSSGLTVDSEYHVNFRRDVLARGCGMWMLGSLADVQERGDNFSLMAERGRRAAQGLLKSLAEQSQDDELYGEQAVL